MKLEFLGFVWYDIWVGLFIDLHKKCAYIFLIPCIGFKVSWGLYKSGKPKRYCKVCNSELPENHPFDHCGDSDCIPY